MFDLIKDIDDKAKANSNFREVLATSQNTQVVLMSIPVGVEIGEEVHKENDQILYLVEGDGKAVIDGQEFNFNEDDLVLVHAGTKHNFSNSGDEEMKIITFYAPPHHPPDTVQRTKQEGMSISY